MIKCAIHDGPQKFMTTKIVFYSPGKDSQPWLDSFATALPGAEIWAWTPECAERQAEYAVCWAPPAALFAGQHKLKAIFNIGAGADRVMQIPDIAALTKGATIIRLNDAGMAVQMAEYVCHALIRHTREFAHYEAQQQRHEWKTLPAIDRARWPVGIMGLGSIGARVAQAVAAFEYPVFGWSRTRRQLPGVVTFSGRDNLERFLREVRVLVCLLPLTGETAGILNADTLGKLKPPAYLINVARGAHLVECDLLALLEDETLAGATLDVFGEEPLPPAHAFWNHPRITLTPHISAITLREESVKQIVEKIGALASGNEVDGIVRANIGY